MRTPEQEQEMSEQIALSKSLGLGFALSVVPTAGVGSIAAIVIGLRARKKIATSRYELTGSGMAAWCIIVGSLGLIMSVGFLGSMVLSD
jgi:hypothetical protein